MEYQTSRAPLSTAPVTVTVQADRAGYEWRDCCVFFPEGRDPFIGASFYAPIGQRSFHEDAWFQMSAAERARVIVTAQSMLATAQPMAVNS